MNDVLRNANVISAINIKVTLIGVLIASCIDFLVFPFVQTVLNFATTINFAHPLSHYLLWGYLPLSIAGIYVGLSKAGTKILNGILVGISYLLISRIVASVVLQRNSFEITLLTAVLGMLRYGIICALISWGTYKIVSLVRSRK